MKTSASQPNYLKRFALTVEGLGGIIACTHGQLSAHKNAGKFCTGSMSVCVNCSSRGLSGIDSTVSADIRPSPRLRSACGSRAGNPEGPLGTSRISPRRTPCYIAEFYKNSK